MTLFQRKLDRLDYAVTDTTEKENCPQTAGFLLPAPDPEVVYAPQPKT